MEPNVTFGDAIAVARNLKSEHGENSEYDRALVELIRDMFGYLGMSDGDDAREVIEFAIGIK